MTLRTRRPGLGVDLGLGVGVGLLVALMAVGLPIVITILLAIAILLSTPLFARLDQVDRMASMLVVAAAFTMPMNRLFLLPVPVPASDLLLMAAVGLYCLMRITEARPPVTERTYRPIVIGFVLLGFGGLIGSFFEVPGPFMYKALGVDIRDISGFGQNMGNLGKFLGGSLIPIAMWALARPSRAFMRQILGAFTSGAVVSAFVGFTPFGAGAGRFVGMTVHPNQFGSLSLLALGPAVGLALTTKSSRVRGACLLAMPILAFAILGSGSRAALGGTAVLGLIIGPLTRSRAVMGIVLTGVACVLMLFLTGNVKTEGENALGRTFGDSATAEGSDSIRESLHSAVWHRFTERPLTGNGYNYMRPSHNVYLGLIASAGLLGVLGLGVIVTTVVRRFWRKRADLLVAAVTASYLAYLCNAYFDNIFWWRWLWFYVGMVIAVGATQATSREVGGPSATPVEDEVEADDADADADSYADGFLSTR